MTTDITIRMIDVTLYLLTRESLQEHNIHPGK